MEPVTPDPKKLRRTAWILVVIMVVGGILVLKAYEKRTQEGESDDRPSFVTQISAQKDLTFIRQDGKLDDLMSLKGKVLVVQSLPQSQPDAMTTGVMERLSERFANEDDFALVTLMLDPGEPEDLKGELEKLSGELGATLHNGSSPQTIGRRCISSSRTSSRQTCCRMRRMENGSTMARSC